MTNKVQVKPNDILVLPNNVVINTSRTGRAYFQKRTQLNENLYRKHLLVKTVKKENRGFHRITFADIMNSFMFGQNETSRMNRYLFVA